MKIISKHKDYYDNMRCYAMCSDDFTYIRKTEEFELTENRYSFLYIRARYDEGFKYDIEVFAIGFCGKFYQGYKVLIPRPFKPTITKITYDLEEALNLSLDVKYIKKHYRKNDFHVYSHIREAKSSTLQGTLKKLIKNSKSELGKEFSRFSDEMGKLNLFEKHNTPTFMLSEGKHGRLIKLTVNPALKDFKFYKVFEGHIAYQEIEMFVGNILLKPDDPMQITDDAILAQQKGFDSMSFKKYPTKRKYKK